MKEKTIKNEVEYRRIKLMRGYDIINSDRTHMLGYATYKNRFEKTWKLFTNRFEFQFLPHYPGRPPIWRLLFRGIAGPRTLPDFCVIGAIKSGTSDLAINLLLHPNVMTPLAKEFRAAEANDWKVFYSTEKEKKRHAENYGVALSPYLGPFLHSIELVSDLSKISPNCKIVLTLRNPTQRMYSHWKWESFLCGKKRAEKLPFLSSFSSYVDHALTLYPEHPMYTKCGFPALQSSIYWKAVNNWINHFGRHNVLVLNVDDYFSDTELYLAKIQEFVGLPYFSIPASSVRANENPVNFPPADADSILKLDKFFASHNEKLWDIIGEKFNW